MSIARNLTSKFWISIFISTLVLLVVCIFQINALTEEIYSVKSCEKEISQLSGENGILEVNFSKSNSLKNIETYFQNQNFEKVTQVKYIHILEGSVAAKK